LFFTDLAAEEMAKGRSLKDSKRKLRVPDLAARTHGLKRRPSPGTALDVDELGRGESKSGANPSAACEKQRHLGSLTMTGPRVAQHKDEILDLVHDTIKGMGPESYEVPSIRISESPACFIEVSFTKAHLAREIGRILHGKYGGELDIQAGDGGESMSVTWWR
jgi:hypothetical protein